jgi:hypothetical protein
MPMAMAAPMNFMPSSPIASRGSIIRVFLLCGAPSLEGSAARL